MDSCEESELGSESDSDASLRVDDPAVRLKIDRIAEILSQTSSNLARFENLLPAYNSQNAANLTASMRVSSPTTKSKRDATSQVADEFRPQLFNSHLELEYQELMQNYLVKEQECQSLRDELTLLKIESRLRDAGSAPAQKRPPVADKEIITSAIPTSEVATSPSQKAAAGPSEAPNIPEQCSRCAASEAAAFHARQSKQRLKVKTRKLLHQYRIKRSKLIRRDNQLQSVRAGLIRLQDLHRSLDIGQVVLLQHVGHIVHDLARITVMVQGGEQVPPDPGICSTSGLASWLTNLEKLANFTKESLIRGAWSGKADCVRIQVKKTKEAEASLEPRGPSLDASFPYLFVNNAKSKEDVLETMINEIGHDSGKS